MNTLQEGDEIVISIAEHHSNLLPWQQVAAAKKAKLVYLYLDENGIILEQKIETKISQKAKIVSVTHASDVLGVMSPMESIVKKAHEVGAIVIADLTQSIAHRKLELDFAVFSGHKMYAPMGISVLFGTDRHGSHQFVLL